MAAVLRDLTALAAACRLVRSRPRTTWLRAYQGVQLPTLERYDS